MIKANLSDFFADARENGSLAQIYVSRQELAKFTVRVLDTFRYILDHSIHKEETMLPLRKLA